jgi:hypothetical protein
MGKDRERHAGEHERGSGSEAAKGKSAHRLAGPILAVSGLLADMDVR